MIRSRLQSTGEAAIAPIGYPLRVRSTFCGSTETPGRRAILRSDFPIIGATTNQYVGGILVNRSELVAAVADSAGTSKSDADAVLNALGDTLIDAVKKGDKVQIPGLLTVERVERSARTGRNPATGETLNIPAGFGVKVSAGSKLKNAVK